MNSLTIESDGRVLTRDVGIRRIHVERLFGQYTYDLFDKELPIGRANTLLLLYGDNGSGKTTIMRLLFYILSHADGRGHKSAVCKIPFRRFSIQFADGTNVIAERAQDSLRPYELRVMKAREVLASSSYGVEQPKPLPSGSSMEDMQAFVSRHKESAAQGVARHKLLACLKELNLGVIYVTDTRHVFSTVAGFMGRGDDSADDSGVAMRTTKKQSAEDSGRGALSSAVSQISAWATQQALQGSAQGEEDVNSAYAAIMKRLAHAPELISQATNTETVIANLHEQGRRSLEFVRFGLMKPLKTDEIVEELQSANDTVRESMLAVVEPYITGFKARLDALEPIRARLAAFVDTMNSFYRNKQVSLDVSGGLRITAATGEELPPSFLSSGEGQLLYLFASTLVAKDRSSLFMIDEPELSLNVKWQRQLLKSLLDFTAGSNIQFVLATHSIELLTRYNQYVCDLNTVQEPLFK